MLDSTESRTTTSSSFLTDSKASGTSTCSSSSPTSRKQHMLTPKLPEQEPQDTQHPEPSTPVCQEFGEGDTDSISSATDHAHKNSKETETTSEDARTIPKVTHPENDESISSNSNSNNTDIITSAAIDGNPPAANPKVEKEIKDTTSKTKKKSIGFEPISTMYVFEDDDSGKGEEGYYNVDNTWYSSQDLKAFRADVFITINWMIMKGIDPSTIVDNKRARPQPPQKQQHKHKQLKGLMCSSSSSQQQDNNKCDYNYYSNKYSSDRHKEINAIAQKANYEFCERGVECRTPLRRLIKNKRRVDAMRVVMLYQQMQKQHRRQRRREQRRQQDSLPRVDKPFPVIRRHRPDPEALRKIEADIDVNALANVYGSYCKESSSEAFGRGIADALEAGIPVSLPPLPSTNTSTATQLPLSEQEVTRLVHPYDLTRIHTRIHTRKCKGSTTTTTAVATTIPPAKNYQNARINCPSLCDEEDEDDDFMDKLVSLSYVNHDEDECEALDDNESPTLSSVTLSSRCKEGLPPPKDDDDSSVGSDSSLSLGDLVGIDIEDEATNYQVEVELIEGNNDEQPHRIYCSNSGSCTTNSPRKAVHRHRGGYRTRSNSWSCSSMPTPASPQQQHHPQQHPLGLSPPKFSSFSSLELGRFFFGAATSQDWW